LTEGILLAGNLMKSLRLLMTVGFAAYLAQAGQADWVRRRVAIEWQSGRPQGTITVTDGTLSSVTLARGKGTATAARFAASEGPFRLELQLTGSEVTYGPGAAIVTVAESQHPFSFFLRDVQAAQPVFMPAYGVVVTDASDARSYDQIAAAIRARGLESKLERIENEPEASWDDAAANTRNLQVPTWLGLARDMRLFEFDPRLGSIRPHFAGEEVPLPEAGGKNVGYEFLMGRGWGARERIERRLEDGVLPILHGRLTDDDVTYNLTAFAGLETHPLTRENVRGTHFLVADRYGYGHMFTQEQQAELDRLLPSELNQPEETVLFLRITAVNTAPVPRYAFFKNPAPGTWSNIPARYELERATGLAVYQSGRVFSVSKLNGRALSQEEVAISLAPGQAAVLEIYLPHRPVSRERASALGRVSFEERLAGCRSYWKQKLAEAGVVRVPESRIQEMVRAGLLHLDVSTYGREPGGTLTPTIGVYSSIGSESSPIVQFMDAMGWHDTARRALTYFLDKQHDDGFIQNFGGYMLETGAALWSMGEHYRYTHDDAWVREIAPKLVKSCEFLRRWRERNLREDLRGKGYGMLEGKTADPEDPFRSFMLNGYAYLGLSRVAEMLRSSNPAEAEKWSKEAEGLKQDIRTALFEVMGRSPVIPLGDGTWVPTAPPWVEYRGPLSLYADGGKWFTHGSMVSRDSLLGPIYLIFQEVLDPNEPASTFLLSFHSDLMTMRNTAFSQPYYSRHPMSHLRRGEVKPFLEAYYNTVAGLADRETYTFWEHYFHASPHKTHEEGWFLMDTRWMLYMERGDTLNLLPGIPRRWLENGKEIELSKVATYFGPLSLRVTSLLEQGRIEANVECATDRKPKAVELRLPHPLGLRPAWVKGGTYDPATERVRIAPFDGRAHVELGYTAQ
jgi:hypothetical protein